MVVDSQPCFKTSNACKAVFLFFSASLHNWGVWGGGGGVISLLHVFPLRQDPIFEGVYYPGVQTRSHKSCSSLAEKYGDVPILLHSRNWLPGVITVCILVLLTELML